MGSIYNLLFAWEEEEEEERERCVCVCVVWGLEDAKR